MRLLFISTIVETVVYLCDQSIESIFDPMACLRRHFHEAEIFRLGVLSGHLVRHLAPSQFILLVSDKHDYHARICVFKDLLVPFVNRLE